MNNYLDSLKVESNYIRTENGALAHASTLNSVLDLFAFGGSYRNRSKAECEILFKNAYEEDPTLALKCLFYLRDCRGGQGERRFFRICLEWLAITHPTDARYLIKYIPVFGRWDDLFVFNNTILEKDVAMFISKQLEKDLAAEDNNISLCAKWLPSENTSSQATREKAKKLRKWLGYSPEQYRKVLSILRKKINIIETLMSQNKWEEINFSKIPSRAGFIYQKAFLNHVGDKYIAFMASNKTKVNASVLYPYDIAHKYFNSRESRDSLFKETLQKYWENLPDYFEECHDNGIAVIDVSGSMCGRPLEAAISLGIYVAEKNKGDFANHFITFSETPSLVSIKGDNIVDKFNFIQYSNWGFNTNIEAVFDLLLRAAKRNNTPQKDMPDRLYIFSDMEFDEGLDCTKEEIGTLIENIKQQWAQEGYELPEIVFWNLDARQNNIAAIGDEFSYVSGLSPSILKAVLSNKTGWDLCLEVLNSKRYEDIKSFLF